MHQPRAISYRMGQCMNVLKYLKSFLKSFFARAPTFLPSFEKKIPAILFLSQKAMMTRMLSFSVFLFAHTFQIQKGGKRGSGFALRFVHPPTRQNNWILECRSGGASMEDCVGQRWALVC
ncbi:uncharacterized protein TrAtP1_008229 [Trichoderma atroviride]|uniref:uncharacterized protein n=1 Tax=Hypocrea atroviridis TaxID=63577 RepID=UPI0033277187|nr:hypothetical protein TrAtP1_008229 [Trichoderma atroviride]